MTEEKEVPFAQGYWATSDGNIVRRRGKTRFLRPTKNYAGYLVCDLYGVQYRVNRIICETFHGKPPSPSHHAAHKDGNRTNNSKDNLYWATISENARDLARHGSLKGEGCGNSKLTDVEVKDIKLKLKSGMTLTRVHRGFYPHVCYATISHIKQGRIWTHIHV